MIFGKFLAHVPKSIFSDLLNWKDFFTRICSISFSMSFLLLIEGCVFSLMLMNKLAKRPAVEYPFHSIPVPSMSYSLTFVTRSLCLFPPISLVTQTAERTPSARQANTLDWSVFIVPHALISQPLVPPFINDFDFHLLYWQMTGNLPPTLSISEAVPQGSFVGGHLVHI